jgi:uncharacterized protein (DUF924 family)
MAIDGMGREILRFWFGTGDAYGKRHKRWFEKDARFDAEVTARFGDVLAQISAGAHADWLDEPASCLAYILVLDQFSRHIFRGSARAFAGDPLALRAARHALEQRFDEAMLPVERLFLYLPFEHSEALEDQDRACALMEKLVTFPETDDALRYAEAHRAVIARFGRFPHRNAALRRTSTSEELQFLKQPGSAF